VIINLAENMECHAANFLAYLRDRNFSPNTIERYKRVLGAFVEFLGQQDSTSAITPQAVTKSAVITFLRRLGRNGKEPSGVVWNIRLACLRSFFGYLYREELVPENPAVKVEFAKPVQRDPVYLTCTEYRQLLDTIKQIGHNYYRDRDRAIVIALFHTGLRLSELVSLDIYQVDWPNEVFRGVRRKGGKVKDVPFNSEVTTALATWLKKRASLCVPNAEAALFISDRRTRIKARTVEQLFSRYSEKAGLGKKVTPHVLRHTTATELLRRGEDIRIVSEVLNHSNLNTTKRYTHLIEGAEKRAVDRLAER
jgi:site-specific recombinase XerD